MWSSDEFRKAWRYAVSSDLRSVDRSPATTSTYTAITAGPTTSRTVIREFGSEQRSITLERPPSSSWFSSSLNSDGSLVAIPCDAEIDIYDTGSGTRTVLAGHADVVGSFGFSPLQPKILVSSAIVRARVVTDKTKTKSYTNRDRDRDRDADNPSENRDLALTSLNIAKGALRSICARFESAGSSLTTEEKEELQSVLFGTLGRFTLRRLTPDSARLDGRLKTSFQSNLFSNNGDILIYLPGSRPRSNGDDTWDIALYSLGVTGRTVILSGHRDSIMWVGFSPDDTLVASASWDGTFRIWDVTTGSERWKFTTGKQNWTGVFSPDGRRFLGTDGLGIVRVWDMETGREEMKYDQVEARGGGVWRRAVDWSPDGRWVVVGTDALGIILLFDMANQEEEVIDGKVEIRMKPVQERRLSLDRTELPPERKSMSASMLAIRSLKFLALPSGLTLVCPTSNDPGLNVTNLQNGTITRYAPAEGADLGIQVQWMYLAATSEIGIISKDKIRFWKL